ncbi:MAG: MBL fold metallo-hydrolase, partial [Dehalococcoidia bacterium]
RFLGAAGSVTGSRFLVEAAGSRVLVDCGLFQERQFADRDWADFPVAPSSIDAVVLTHAHLDHTGYLPKLVRDGFRGRIFCTKPTAEIAAILLEDAAHILEEDAAGRRRRHDREGRRGPHDERPLYTVRDARAVPAHFSHVRYRRRAAIVPGVTAEFFDAGHILGSAILRLTLGDCRVVFSGDLGRSGGGPILQRPADLPEAEAVVVESTYGDRLHPAGDVETRLQDAIAGAVARGGNVVIPSFAVERAQDVLYHLGRLVAAARIPRLMIFVDSPMATSVTQLFARHRDLLAPAIADAFARGDSPFEWPGLTFVHSVEQSKAINQIRGSAVIIAGAGMCNGGRVKHHLAANIGRAESTILFVGYQAQGTLGRQIVDGESPVRILGRWYDVRARIERVDEFSAHADRSELIDWLTASPTATQPPRRVFVVHGEAAASAALADALRARLPSEVIEARYGERVAIC